MAQAGPRSYSESGWQKLARGGSLEMRWPHSKGWTLSQGQGLLQSPTQAKLQTKNSTSRRLEPPQPTGQAAPRQASPWRPGGRGPHVQGSPIYPVQCDLMGLPTPSTHQNTPRGEEDGGRRVSLRDGIFLLKRVLTPPKGTVKSSRNGTGQLVHFPLLLVGAQEEGQCSYRQIEV